ncbi:type II toxin-antitoxin system VapB family antitoxin [Sphingomonas mucosissima]|uniref:Antitoxin VapB11 n=1 Tax=Sphingomonas mucosissima TaxID=370959 RepID=A0A245ZFR4_9SPHN|nr:type II toxin-antitoxin system VapB family antitoxin [Sphingomonas mucosissima]OWK28590.1 antitoxin VapB11 [Sphingomonas mucosissima]
MRTNIVIDDELIDEVMKGFGVRTMREAVDRALRESLAFIRQQQAVQGMRGLGWEGDLDVMRTDKPLPEWD